MFSASPTVTKPFQLGRAASQVTLWILQIHKSTGKENFKKNHN